MGLKRGLVAAARSDILLAESAKQILPEDIVDWLANYRNNEI